MFFFRVNTCLNILFMVMFYFDIILMVLIIIFIYLFIHDDEWVGRPFGSMDLIINFYL